MPSNKNTTTNHLFYFFLLTFLFSWLLWLPGILKTYDLIDINQTFGSLINTLNWIAGIGPSFSGILLIYKCDGKAGIKKLFSRVAQFKLGYWYLPTFLLIPFILLLAHTLNKLLFSSPFPETGLLSQPWWIPLLFAIFILMQFSEELGWRGFALDLLQHKLNALFSSIFLGMGWALWHLPMFFMEGFGQHENNLPFGHFFITIILVSVLITWVQNNTNYSLIPAFSMHALINLSGEVLPLIDKVTGDSTVWVIVNILFLFCVIIIVLIWGPAKLANKTLLGQAI